MLDRLQKILSRHGIASRREAEQIILAGRLAVNGQKITELGTKADPESDRIEVDGKLLQINAPEFVYLLLHKPTGVVSTCDDPQGRKTILDLLPSQYQHLYPVGRLDYNSSGALLLTNDGDFANRLMHPRHHIPKTYEVWVKGIPSQRTIQQWREGIVLDGKQTLPASVNILQVIDPSIPKVISSIQKPQNQNLHKVPRSQLQIILSEGRNRQIRRVAEQLGHPVLALHRVEIGSILLDSLKSGTYRLLKANEIKSAT